MSNIMGGDPLKSGNILNIQIQKHKKYIILQMSFNKAQPPTYLMILHIMWSSFYLWLIPKIQYFTTFDKDFVNGQSCFA